MFCILPKSKNTQLEWRWRRRKRSPIPKLKTDIKHQGGWRRIKIKFIRQGHIRLSIASSPLKLRSLKFQIFSDLTGKITWIITFRLSKWTYRNICKWPVSSRKEAIKNSKPKRNPNRRKFSSKLHLRPKLRNMSNQQSKRKSIKHLPKSIARVDSQKEIQRRIQLPRILQVWEISLLLEILTHFQRRIWFLNHILLLEDRWWMHSE